MDFVLMLLYRYGYTILYVAAAAPQKQQYSNNSGSAALAVSGSLREKLRSDVHPTNFIDFVVWQSWLRVLGRSTNIALKASSRVAGITAKLANAASKGIPLTTGQLCGKLRHIGWKSIERKVAWLYYERMNFRKAIFRKYNYWENSSCVQTRCIVARSWTKRNAWIQ